MRQLGGEDDGAFFSGSDDDEAFSRYCTIHMSLLYPRKDPLIYSRCTRSRRVHVGGGGVSESGCDSRNRIFARRLLV